MIDYIIHVPSLSALVAALLKSNPEYVDTTDPKNPVIVQLTRTPATINPSNSDEMMAYVRDLPTAWSQYSSLVNVLAEAPYDPAHPGDAVYTALFADSAAKATYDSVYPRTPVSYTDQSGQTQTYTPPERFGVVA